ncbi:MAG: hypothetical protein ABII79_08010, partial [bacterium]
FKSQERPGVTILRFLSDNQYGRILCDQRDHTDINERIRSSAKIEISGRTPEAGTFKSVRIHAVRPDSD